MRNGYPLGQKKFEWEEDLGQSHGWPVAKNMVGVAMRVKRQPNWYIEAHFRIVRRGIELDQLALLPVLRDSRPRASQASATIRSINLGQLYSEAHQWLDRLRHTGSNMVIDARAFRQNRRPGREGRSDYWYARVSLYYLEFCSESRHPLEDLATGLGVSVSTARDVVHEARERGLLSKTKQGQRGGYLTKKGWDALEENVESVPRGLHSATVLGPLQPYRKKGS